MKIGFTILIVALVFSCGENKKKESSNGSSGKMEKRFVIIDDSTIATKDPMKVIDPLWWTVDIYNSKEQYEEDLEPYSVPQRAVFAIMWYMGEVNNGGHYQFYTNSTGIAWEDARDGFDLVGVGEAREIIEESARRFGGRPSFERAARESYLDSIDEDFADLDSRFYNLDAEIDLTGKVMQYILSNPTPFYFEGEIEVPK